MAICWVLVQRSDGGGLGDEIYISGNYVEAAGFIDEAFLTETGQATFETLDAAGKPNWQRVQIVARTPTNRSDRPELVILAPIGPLAPMGLVDPGQGARP